MTQYVGLDISLKETKLHVLDEAGNRIWRGRCATEAAAIAAAVRRYAPTAVRIGLETGPLTTWLWTALRAEGLPMVCLDARHAKKALDMKVNKTDANDAEGGPSPPSLMSPRSRSPIPSGGRARLVPGSGLHRGASSREKWTMTATSRDVVIASCALCFTKLPLCS